MPLSPQSVSTVLEEFKEPGLYLIFPDRTCLKLTKDNIEERCAALFADESKIPPHVKEAKEFQLCTICPMRGSNETCHAIRPIMAYWENVDQYFSYDSVTAIYRSRHETLQISHTSMQHALKYLSILSLMHYCETGKKYWKYFSGVTPLMEPHEIATRVYLNIFYLCNGDSERVKKVIERFSSEITQTTHCQMDRVRLFCKHDAFSNALVLTQLAGQILNFTIDSTVKKSFEDFEQKGFAA